MPPPTMRTRGMGTVRPLAAKRSALRPKRQLSLAEVTAEFACRLGRHRVGGLVALAQLERDAERLPAAARPAGGCPFAPPVAQGQQVEARHDPLGRGVF